MNGLKICTLLLALSLSFPSWATDTPNETEGFALLPASEFNTLDLVLSPDPAAIQEVDFVALTEAIQDESVRLLGIAKAENAKRVSMRRSALTDTECLATAMYHEARGEGVRGMTAVAFVIHNRVQNLRYPKNYCAVVLQKSQFSFVTDRNPDNIKSWDIYAKALALSVELLQHNGFERQKSPVGAALFFNSLALSKKALYSYGRKYVATIGNHHFFR